MRRAIEGCFGGQSGADRGQSGADAEGNRRLIEGNRGLMRRAIGGSRVSQIRSEFDKPAEFILLVEKDAAFQ
eukprot:1640465-Rhodomonas_salina.1